jgi:hypothetical protein
MLAANPSTQIRVLEELRGYNQVNSLAGQGASGSRAPNEGRCGPANLNP